MNFVYTPAIDVADFNYGPYVQQMKSKGVQWVQFIGAYQQSVAARPGDAVGRLQARGALYDPSVYDQNFLKTGGSAVEGAFMFINFTPLEESQPELNLYKKWLQQVAPGAQPTFFGAVRLVRREAVRGEVDRSSAASSPARRWSPQCQGTSTPGRVAACTAPMDVGASTRRRASGSCRSRTASSSRYGVPSTSATACT